MNISKMGVAELASYEALILSPYLDSGGVKTVGIGSTSSDIKDLNLWPWDKQLSIQEAVNLYVKSLSKYVAAVNKALTRLEIPQHQFDALVSITYNIGTSGMANSTFMKYVNQGRSDKDVVGAMARWNKDNGVVVKGLVNRRAKEAVLYTSGVYNSKGMVNLVPVNTSHRPVYAGGKLIDIMSFL